MYDWWQADLMELTRSDLLLLLLSFLLLTLPVSSSSTASRSHTKRNKPSRRNPGGSGVTPGQVVAGAMDPPLGLGENTTTAPTTTTSTQPPEHYSPLPEPPVDKFSLLAIHKSQPAISNLKHPRRPDVQVGCKELRSKRYISDGFCTSIKPVTEVVCTGHCLPIRNLPWYAEFIKVWSRTKVLEHRCVNDLVKRRRVRLLCENGETRTYRIKVVKSCKCKRYMKQQNMSLFPSDRRSNQGSYHRRKEKDKRKKKKKKKPRTSNQISRLRSSAAHTQL